MTMKNMVEDMMNKISKIENEYYNAFSGNIFEVAMYLFMRYGEIPYEIDNDNVEENLEKLSKIIRRYDSVYNQDLNDEFEELMWENKENDEDD